MPRRAGAWPTAALGLLLILLAGCERGHTIHHDQLLAFGTVVELSLYGVEATQARTITDALDRRLRAQHEAWSPSGDGELSRLNQTLAGRGAGEAGPELMELLQRSQTLSQASGGLFEPAIGRLVALWGFERADVGLPIEPPEAAAVAELVSQRPQIAALQLGAGRVRGAYHALQLNLGASAKGYAVEGAIDALREAGVPAAIVNAGGDLKVLGRPGERRWRIGIRHPDGGVLASIELEDGEALFSSGDYERYFEHGGRRYHHLLDPRTGYPARGLRAVTVLHHDATTADAAATALFVAGPDAWPAVARAMGVAHALLLDESGRAQLTPALAERLRFEYEPAPQRLIVSP